MSIRDCSNLPDHLVPSWVAEHRRQRCSDKLKLCSCGLHFSARKEVLNHCDSVGHKPLVPYELDKYLKR